MKRLLFVLAIIAAGSSHPSVVNAQSDYHAIVYGYNPASAKHWVSFADGDSLATAIYQGHMVPTTEGFPPVAWTCIDTWYQHAGQRVGGVLGICTSVDDDGDWFRYTFVNPPDAWEGTSTCIDGTGKYEGITCELSYRGLSNMGGSGWFRGEIEGTMMLK